MPSSIFEITTAPRHYNLLSLRKILSKAKLHIGITCVSETVRATLLRSRFLWNSQRLRIYEMDFEGLFKAQASVSLTEYRCLLMVTHEGGSLYQFFAVTATSA
jgi:hypothetical protein